MLIHQLGERHKDLAKAYQKMNLWRIPRMKVEAPTLLVYTHSTDVAAAAKANAGDITAQIEDVSPAVEVHLQYHSIMIPL